MTNSMNYNDLQRFPSRVHAHARKRVLNVLIACEDSQAETMAFRALGHRAFSCDIQPCQRKGNPAWHIQGDVRPLLRGGCHFLTQNGSAHHVAQWDLIIAHPPGTYLSKVSSVQLYKNADCWRLINGIWREVNRDRYWHMLEARQFFFECLAANAKYVAVENPIPMKAARLPPCSFFADPSWYGVKYTKKMLYWVKNLPPLLPELIHPTPKCYVRCSRGEYRSRTFPEMARAIAEQWITFILQDKESPLALN